MVKHEDTAASHGGTRPLVGIVGPTAAGKSALGMALAREFGGEVVVCDSTQVYRGFNIGTAKVPASEQQGIPHHLMDLLEPHQTFTAGAYRQCAIAVLEDLAGRGKLPVFTVGTGLYFRALVEGLADAPARSEALREELRRKAAERRGGYLHRLLKKLDPPAAARVAPGDEPKLIRAIEICVLSGKRVTEVHATGRPGLAGWRPTRIGLNPPRKLLYARIEQRTDAMLAAGWLEEVRRLLEAEADPKSKPFQFIGYSELRSHLLGVVPLAAARSAIHQATRRYAKRQITWFRREPDVHWLEGFGDDAAIAAAAAEYLSRQLAAMPAVRAGAANGI